MVRCYYYTTTSSFLLLAALFRQLWCSLIGMSMMLALLLTTTTPAAISAQEEPAYPTVRFTVYDDLSSTARAAATTNLDYNENNWNAVGTAAIEQLSYETIENNSALQARSISNQLEMNEESWDCYINHYDDYDWDELDDDAGVQGSFRTLGYTQSSWQNNGAVVTDNLDWSELSFAQRSAAENICYFQETWDEESLPFDPPSTGQNALVELLIFIIQAFLSWLGLS